MEHTIFVQILGSGERTRPLAWQNAAVEAGAEQAGVPRYAFCLSCGILGDRQLLRSGREQAEFEDIQIENMDLGNVEKEGKNGRGRARTPRKSG